MISTILGPWHILWVASSLVLFSHSNNDLILSWSFLYRKIKHWSKPRLPPENMYILYENHIEESKFEFNRIWNSTSVGQHASTQFGLVINQNFPVSKQSSSSLWKNPHPRLDKKTLPEAQRTQGIASLTWISFLTLSDSKCFKLIHNLANCVVPLV